MDSNISDDNLYQNWFNLDTETFIIVEQKNKMILELQTENQKLKQEISKLKKKVKQLTVENEDVSFLDIFTQLKSVLNGSNAT